MDMDTIYIHTTYVLIYIYEDSNLSRAGCIAHAISIHLTPGQFKFTLSKGSVRSKRRFFYTFSFILLRNPYTFSPREPCICIVTFDTPDLGTPQRLQHL